MLLIPCAPYKISQHRQNYLNKYVQAKVSQKLHENCKSHFLSVNRVSVIWHFHILQRLLTPDFRPNLQGRDNILSLQLSQSIPLTLFCYLVGIAVMIVFPEIAVLLHSPAKFAETLRSLRNMSNTEISSLLQSAPVE